MTSDTGTVDRVLALLRDLAAHPQTTAKEASARLGWPMSTTHRMLRTLSQAGFAQQDGRGVFSAGGEFYRIAGQLSATMPYVRFAEPLLASLTERFGEMSLMAIMMRERLQMYFSHAALPADAMRYAVELNRPSPIVWGASGRAMLAFLPTVSVREAAGICDIPDATGRMLDINELETDLEAIRGRGYAVTVSQLTLSAVGVAVPFFDSRGHVVGSLTIRLPQFRFVPDMAPKIGEALKEAASRLSHQIGGSHVIDARA